MPGETSEALQRLFAPWALASVVLLQVPSTTSAHGQAAVQSAMANLSQLEGVDTFIRQEMAEQHIPGLSVSVSSHGRLVYEIGYGVSNTADKAPVTPQTPFYTASVTKAFTGTALILLESQHKLDLDRPVNDYLSGAKLQSPKWNTNAATVRRVANHTGGLTTYNRKCNVGNAGCEASTARAIQQHAILFWPPGDHFDYSNIGYGVLGQVVADVSGLPFDRFLQHELFQPLGMNSCYLQIDPKLKKGSSFNYAPGTLAQTPIQISDTPGASSARCSSHDLAVFGEFVMGDRVAGQKQILSPDQLHELLYSDAASAGEKYSFGWDRNNVDSYPGLFAQGGTYDSFALLQLIPDQDLAVAVVSNTGTTIPLDIANRIVEQLALKPRAAQQAAAQEASKATTSVGQPLSGTWSGSVRVDGAEVPVALNITSTHVQATIGGKSASCEKVELSSSRLDCTVDTALRSTELPTGIASVELEVYRRDNSLIGAATTQGPVQLPFWIALRPTAGSVGASTIDH